MRHYGGGREGSIIKEQGGSSVWTVRVAWCHCLHWGRAGVRSTSSGEPPWVRRDPHLSHGWECQVTFSPTVPAAWIFKLGGLRRHHTHTHAHPQLKCLNNTKRKTLNLTFCRKFYEVWVSFMVMHFSSRSRLHFKCREWRDTDHSETHSAVHLFGTLQWENINSPLISIQMSLNSEGKGDVIFISNMYSNGILFVEAPCHVHWCVITGWMFLVWRQTQKTLDKKQLAVMKLISALKFAELTQ